jgi:hypothetical protein
MDRNNNTNIDFRKVSALSDNNKTVYSSLTYLMYIKDKKLKFGISFATVSLLASLIFSIMSPIFENEIKILSFEYTKTLISDHNIKNVFCINLIMFYIFLVLIIIINLYFVYLLIKETDSLLIHFIYSDLKWFIFLTQICLACTFMIGLVFSKSNATLISIVSLSILIILLICFYYKWVKQKKNLSFASFTTLFFYTSVILFFMIYLSFSNISEILVINLKNNEDLDITLIKEICLITSLSIFLIITIVLITYFKDVIFSLTFSYFLIGYLIPSNTISKKELYAAIVILTFNVVAVILTIIKYGKSAFGYEGDRTVEEILAARAEHKKSSWCSYERIG